MPILTGGNTKSNLFPVIPLEQDPLESHLQNQAIYMWLKNDITPLP
jgi:hypothetical protein